MDYEAGDTVLIPDGYFADGRSRPARTASILDVQGTMARVEYLDNKQRETVTTKAFRNKSDSAT